MGLSDGDDNKLFQELSRGCIGRLLVKLQKDMSSEVAITAGLELSGKKHSLLRIPALLPRCMFGSNDQRTPGRYENTSFSTYQLKLEDCLDQDIQLPLLQLAILSHHK